MCLVWVRVLMRVLEASICCGDSMQAYPSHWELLWAAGAHGKTEARGHPPAQQGGLTRNSLHTQDMLFRTVICLKCTHTISQHVHLTSITTPTGKHLYIVKIALCSQHLLPHSCPLWDHLKFGIGAVFPHRGVPLGVVHLKVKWSDDGLKLERGQHEHRATYVMVFKAHIYRTW